MYNKLFTKILDSTIWLEDDATRLVWITFLAVILQRLLESLALDFGANVELVEPHLRSPLTAPGIPQDGRRLPASRMMRLRLRSQDLASSSFSALDSCRSGRSTCGTRRRWLRFFMAADGAVLNSSVSRDIFGALR